MKIKVEGQEMFFIPENDLDIFNIGALSTKLQETLEIKFSQKQNVPYVDSRLDWLKTSVRSFSELVFSEKYFLKK